MKKTRMSIDDIHAMVGSLRAHVLRMRVTNIYDLAATSDSLSTRNNKTYILKLHQPPFPKVFLLLESGVRFHTSKYARDASSSSALPSQFTMKLRKHLRGKRLVALTQLEGDRVVDFTFGVDDVQCHLILELYAAGNIVLTDGQYNILSLLRTHRFDEQVRLAVKQVYPLSVLESTSSTGMIATMEALMVFVDKWFKASMEAAAQGKKWKAPSLKQLLLAKDSTFGGLGPVIIEHCIVSAELQPTLKIKTAEDCKALGTEALERLVHELQEGAMLLETLQGAGNERTEEDESTEVVAVPEVPKDSEEKRGFIILREKSKPTDTDQFEEFTPYLYAQHRKGNKRIQSFDTFDEAVDEYFSHFEAQSAEIARQNAKAAAESKVDKLRRRQQQQIGELIETQEKSFKYAQLIEANQQDIENVLLVVRSALASGMDWRGLEELVHFEQKNGNPVACLIHEMDLAHNRVAVLLCDNEDDTDDTESSDGQLQQDAAAHVIWIDLSLSALANAREMYSQKKKAGEKVRKATEATEKAIEAAEKKTQQTLKKQQVKRHAIYERRKTMWFEKFHWFISSEGYLVLAGKDMHQNELLVKRYLRKEDVFVHADLHGAATCIVRNRLAPTSAGIPVIPVATLEQAGCMSVCRSNAWTSQVIASAYWVYSNQVSKSAPSGEYLTTGSFMIRGKKNYINPSRLEMGLAIVFRLEDRSIAHHSDEHDLSPAITSIEDEAMKSLDEDEKIAAPVKDEVTDAPAVSKTEKTSAADEEETKERTVIVKDEDEVATPPAAQSKVEPVEQNTPSFAVMPVDHLDDIEVDQQPQKGSKKRISAKQRRDMKKGKPINDDVPAKPSETQLSTKGSEAAPKAAVSPPAPAVQKNVRGKKGKMKKMKKRYAEQDDDDRRLRMEALGHAGIANESSTAISEPVETELPSESTTSEPQEAPQKNNDEATNSEQPSSEYIQQQRDRKAKFLEQEEEEADAAILFDAFTGTPLPNDVLLHALPMCAPYSALLKYKFKVKLTPGPLKMGKAAKQAMEYFFAMNLKEEKQAAATKHRKPLPDAEEKDDDQDHNEMPDIDPVVAQRELMRCIAETELTACMLGSVKISAQGLMSSKDNKKGKKGKPNKKG